MISFALGLRICIASSIVYFSLDQKNWSNMTRKLPASSQEREFMVKPLRYTSQKNVVTNQIQSHIVSSSKLLQFHMIFFSLFYYF